MLCIERIFHILFYVSLTKASKEVPPSLFP